MSSRFAPTAILTVLDRHQVRYVLVGGYAAQLHGATRPTTDIDVTPQPTQENLTRCQRRCVSCPPTSGSPASRAVFRSAPTRPPWPG